MEQDKDKLKVGIIGATGFLGKSLTKYLTSFFLIHVYSRREKPEGFSDISHWTIGHLHDEKLLISFLESIDVLIHLGQSGKPMESNNNYVYETEANLIPSLQIIEALKKTKKSIHIIFASSGGTVYREKINLLHTENDPTEPLTTYGINKLTLEYYLNALTKISNHSCTTLRISNPYGELLSTGRNQGFIGVSLSRVMEGKEIIIYDNDLIVRDYIHLEDMSSAFKNVIEKRPSGYCVYNIGTGVGASLRDVLNLFEELMEKSIIRIIVKKDSNIKLPQWNVLDITKAKNELHWSPQISLREGLIRMIELKL